MMLWQRANGAYHRPALRELANVSLHLTFWPERVMANGNYRRFGF